MMIFRLNRPRLGDVLNSQVQVKVMSQLYEIARREMLLDPPYKVDRLIIERHSVCATSGKVVYRVLAEIDEINLRQQIGTIEEDSEDEC